MEQNTTSVVSDAELDAKLKVQKGRAGKGILFIAVGVVLMVILGGSLGVVGFVIALVVMGYGIYLRSDAVETMKKCMADAALVPALEKVFDNVTYSQNGRISDDIILHTDMGFQFHIDKIEGSDYIRAEYKGVGIEMSDITLIDIEVSVDADGDRQETDKVMFRGLWLICDFRKRFSADLRLRERAGFLDKLSKSTIQTENAAFNKQFVIQSDSAHDVFYILTPHMMEYIQKMDEKAGGRTYMLFQREGKLHLALDTGRDAFEIHSVNKANAKDLREQFISEIQYVTDLIDELKLVDTLYEK